MKKLLLALFSLTTLLAFSQNSASEYVDGELIVKVKPIYAEKCNKSSIAIPSIQKILSMEKVNKVEKLFPNHNSIKNKTAEDKRVDLSTIYKFKFGSEVDAKKLINQLKKNEKVEYAEYNYLNHLTYTPNDTINYRQWYLGAIQAYQAWNIQKGDTNVVIGITDTGTDTTHEDLRNASAINYADPINGIDDDNDGYVDNYSGWDVANNDNSPQWSISGHGCNVSGIASAVTDNIVGISGCGFNTRLLNVRIDNQSTGQLTGAYEGIVYAADHGAFVISNSWGSHNYSQFAQDIVNYAAINQGALVIAATGNNGNEQRFYPAAYDNVLSVGSTLEGDTVKATSNYGYWADIFAPGENMFTTRQTPTTSQTASYGISGGTSMAAPVVAGVAALVKSQFPTYTAEQVTQQLLTTADNIDAINTAQYQGKLGVGRVNAFRAVSDSSSPGISFINIQVTDNNDNVFTVGDTLRISGDFKNFLANAVNVNASISTIGNKLQLLDASTSLGNINTLNSSSNLSDPFLLKINQGLNFNELIEIELQITANGYAAKQYFTEVVNVDYLTVNENNLTVTLSSNGGVGFSGTSGNLGEGIKYLGGNSLLYEGGFIVGNSGNYVPNKFRSTSGTDDDFDVVQSIRIDNPPIRSDFETTAIFNDGALSPSPQLEILQRNYFFKSGKGVNSVIYVFSIKNISGSPINNLHAGLLMDWDISDFSKNKIYFDSGRKMGVSYATDTNLYAGIRVLNDLTPNHHYAIDNILNGNGGVNIVNGFDDNEKFQVISTNRDSAGTSSVDGNDVLDVNSVGPFNLQHNERFSASFAITIADSIATLEEESDSVLNTFKQFLLGQLNFDEKLIVQESKLFPNPTKEKITVQFNLKSSENLKVTVYDLRGREIYSIDSKYYLEGNQEIDIRTQSWKTGVYFLEILGSQYKLRNKFVVSP